MTTTRKRRRSPAAVALDAVGAVGPGRLLPGAVLLGGLLLAAVGPLVDDPYATATGSTVAGLAVAWLLTRGALQRGTRRVTAQPKLLTSGRSCVGAASSTTAEPATPRVPSHRNAVRLERLDPPVEQAAISSTADPPDMVPAGQAPGPQGQGARA
jgi:hypothetical protein